MQYNYRDNVKGDILSSWIPNKKNYDVYCFALQNCKDVSEEEVSLLKEFFSTSHRWNEKYILVANESLRTWNILRPRPRIVIIARASVTITDLVHSSKILDQGSNKGGIGVEFRMDGQHYCVVCAHFTSKVQKIKEREQDFSAIYSKIIDDNYLRRSSRREKGFTFDHIIFMGDLNYRVQLPGHEEESEVQFEEACGLILEQDWGSLIAADQLRQQLQSNPRLFPGFTEIEHRWPPTSCMDRRRNGYVPKMSGGKPSYEVGNALFIP